MYLCSIKVWGGWVGKVRSVRLTIASCGCTPIDPLWHRSTRYSISVPLGWGWCSWLPDRVRSWSLACNVPWYLLRWSRGRRPWHLWVRGSCWSRDICGVRSPVVPCWWQLKIWIIKWSGPASYIFNGSLYFIFNQLGKLTKRSDWIVSLFIDTYNIFVFDECILSGWIDEVGESIFSLSYFVNILF